MKELFTMVIFISVQLMNLASGEFRSKRKPQTSLTNVTIDQNKTHRNIPRNLWDINSISALANTCRHWHKKKDLCVMQFDLVDGPPSCPSCDILPENL